LGTSLLLLTMLNAEVECKAWDARNICSSVRYSIHALEIKRSTLSDKSINHPRVVTPLMLLIVFIPISTVTVHGVRFVLRGQAMAYLPIITKKVQRRYYSEDGNMDMMTEEHWLLI
jgi:hypothetical protein